MSGRIASPEEMLGLLDTLKQEEEENPSNPLLMMEMLEMLGSNAVMKLHNWGHEFDPSARYNDYYESTGVDSRVAMALGLLTAFAEPGIGQLKGMARGAVRAADSLGDTVRATKIGAAVDGINRVPVRTPSGAVEEVLYRAERADGTGGLFGYGGTNPRGTYFTNDPEYLQAAYRVWDDHNYPTSQFRVRHARPTPRQGSFLDVTGDVPVDWELLNKVEHRVAQDFAGSGAEFDRARLHRIFEEARQGTRTPYDLARDLQYLYRHPEAVWPGRVPQAPGSSLEAALRESGVDLIRQFPDDNSAQVILGGVGNRREYVVLNDAAIQPFQQESLMEFLEFFFPRR